MNISFRAVVNHLFHIFKVYLCFGLFGAVTVTGFALIYAKPWVGAILFVALESLIIAIYLLRNTALVFEVVGVRIEFRKSPRDGLTRENDSDFRQPRSAY